MWTSEIRLPNMVERMWLGCYNSVAQAAQAYDAALYCIHGAGGRFNFPNNERPQLSDEQIGNLSEVEIARIAREFVSADTTIVPAVAVEPSILVSITIHFSCDNSVQYLDMTEEADVSEVESCVSEPVVPANVSEAEP